MMMDGLDHPKTLDLAARLDTSIPQVIGHLELLWAFVAQKTPQGNIGKWPDGTIARASQWTEDASTFVDALRDSGFLDASTEHRYVVHDWPDHCPRWVHAKLKKTGQIFARPDCSADCSADSMPSHATPSQAKPSDEGSAPSDKSLDADTSDETKPDALHASRSRSLAIRDEPTVEQLPLNDGSEHPVPESRLLEWERLYPAVDVPQALRSMRGWLLSNPKKRKTKRGIEKFVTGWLEREQNKGGNTPTGGPNGTTNPANHPQRPQSANERFWARRAGKVFDHG